MHVITEHITLMRVADCLLNILKMKVQMFLKAGLMTPLFSFIYTNGPHYWQSAWQICCQITGVIFFPH